MIEINGFNEVHGMFVPANDTSLIMFYGLPSTGLPIKCYWIRKDRDNL